MNTTTKDSVSKILFRRELGKIGDQAMLLRAIELARLANPNSYIILQCGSPDLFNNHPAIDSLIDLEQPIPEADVRINLGTLQDKHVSKHEGFCNLAANSLRNAGFNAFDWDGVPQSLWVSWEDKAWAYQLVKDRTPVGKIPVGIFWRSDQEFRTWNSMAELVRLLVGTGKYVVFCFDTSEELLEGSRYVVNCVGLPLYRVTALVSCMRLVVTPDSAGLHIAGGLDIPFVALCGATDPKVITEPYKNAIYFDVKCRYHPCWFEKKCIRRKCLRDIKPVRIKQVIEEKFPYEYYLPLWDIPDKEPSRYDYKVALLRFRGIGDVGMSWFAVEALRKRIPNIHITYVTSPSAAALFCGQEDLVDKVEIINYNHPATPTTIPLPPDFDSKKYQKVYNLMNAVDFGDIAHVRPRPDNLGLLMGVEFRPSVVHSLKVNEEEIEWAHDRINLEPGERVVVCQLDSMGRSRFWPIHHWQKLSRLLYNLYGKSIKVVYVSVKEEHKELNVLPNVFNLACETSVRQYIAMAYISSILVCADSSGLHIGGRIPHTKVIGLFGSTGLTDDGRWAHTCYYDNIHPIQSKMKCSPCWDWQHDCCADRLHAPVCMWKIKPKIVFNKIKELLDVS